MGNSRARTSLSFLSDSALIAGLERAVSEGRKIDARVIRMLGEVDERKLFREHACSSLFRFCTERLGMGEGAAYRRIQVARAARRLPILLEALEDGSVHLAGLSTLAPHLTSENAGAVLARAAGKSKREIEALVRELAPKPDVPASIRRVARPKPTPGQVAEPLLPLGGDSIDSKAERSAAPKPPTPARIEPLAPARFHYPPPTAS